MAPRLRSAALLVGMASVMGAAAAVVLSTVAFLLVQMLVHASH